MSTNTRSHRWLLAVPVVLAVVTLTLREGFARGGVPARAAVSDAWEHGYVQPDAGARFSADGETLVLEAGGLLAYAPGLATVRAHGWEASVWGGAVYVSVGQGVTVAAIDVPVIVRGEYGAAVVRPGTQWRAPDVPLPDPLADPVAWAASVRLDPLPAHFVREREAAVAAWSARSAAPSVDLSASVLGAGTTDEIARLALASKPSKTLAAAIRSRGELRLNATVHPAVRDVSWAYVPEDAAVDASTWMGLMTLPLLPAGDASSLTARKWGETLAAAIAASDDADALRSALVPALEQDILRIAADGHPLRALQFADALRAAVGTGSALLTDDAFASFGRLETMTAESLRASALADIGRIPPATTVAPIALPDAAPSAADPALEARARETLAARGGMFTSDSSVRTVEPGIVEVKDVVFGLPSGDRTLRFRYAPGADTVQAVVDGQVQPYPVSWQAYLDWEAGRYSHSLTVPRLLRTLVWLYGQHRVISSPFLRAISSGVRARH